MNKIISTAWFETILAVILAPFVWAGAILLLSLMGVLMWWLIIHGFELLVPAFTFFFTH